MAEVALRQAAMPKCCDAAAMATGAMPPPSATPALRQTNCCSEPVDWRVWGLTA